MALNEVNSVAKVRYREYEEPRVWKKGDVPSLAAGVR